MLPGMGRRAIGLILCVTGGGLLLVALVVLLGRGSCGESGDCSEVDSALAVLALLALMCACGAYLCLAARPPGGPD